MSDLNRRERVTLHVISLLLLFFWGAAGIFLLAASVRDSPLLPPRVLRHAQLAHFPQGWAFFTRSPREAELSVYRPTETGWSSINMRNGSWETFFGLKKGGAINGIELGALVEQIRTWDEATLAREPLLPRLPELVDASNITLENHASVQSICGEVLLIRQEPVPWAWARSGAPVKLASRFKKVSVQCE